MILTWGTAAPAVVSAFLGSSVEAVEAFTIVLAVATIRGWRPAVTGAVAGLILLALLIVVLGPLLGTIPLRALQLAIGVLLLLFGLRWLRKAILRSAGYLALHDESKAFAREEADLQQAAVAHGATGADWIAGLAAFKAVVVEGLEVVFIVVAVGAGPGLLAPAASGAFAACLLVLLVGIAVRRPLERVPENALKFGVGVLLSAFGVFWTGEGLNVQWPGGDLAIPCFAIIFLIVGLSTATLLRRDHSRAA